MRTPRRVRSTPTRSARPAEAGALASRAKAKTTGSTLPAGCVVHEDDLEEEMDQEMPEGEPEEVEATQPQSRHAAPQQPSGPAEAQSSAPQAPIDKRDLHHAACVCG